MKANQDVRDYAAAKNVPIWQIAYAVGMQEQTFVRIFSRELSDEEKDEIKASIDKFVENGRINVGASFREMQQEKSRKKYKDRLTEFSKRLSASAEKARSEQEKKDEKVIKKLKDQLEMLDVWPMNFFADYKSKRIMNPYDENTIKQFFASAVDDRAYEISHARFVKKMTLEEIGANFNISPERVRQIINRSQRLVTRAFRHLVVEANHNDRKKELETIAQISSYNNNYDERLVTRFVGSFPQVISDLDFTVRTYNTLRRNGIHTLSELEQAYAAGQIKGFRNLGKRGLKEIDVAVESVSIARAVLADRTKREAQA